MRHRICSVAIVLAAAMVAAPLVGVSAGTASASSAKAPITIALISSQTGLAAPEDGDANQGFLARIALQNAHGGVNGHRIVPLEINDQSSPSTVVTAVQEAISKGAVGIVSASPVFFLAAKYAQQAGIPVTGGSFDGPEWGTPPNTNMFAADSGSVDPKYPVLTVFSSFLRAHGGSVLGSYAYSISPSSVRGAVSTAKAFQSEGGKAGVLDTSITFGSVDFTSAALTAKQDRVNAVFAAMDANSNVALATALSQAGIKPKAVVFPTGYTPGLVSSPAWPSVKGDYFVAEFRPADVPNAGTRQLTAALAKYEHRPSKQFYDYGIAEAWMGTDLMLTGLTRAGATPTRASVIRSLRGIKSYNGAGLLAHSTNYSTNFGHDPAQTCLWYLQAQKKGFVPVSKQPWCGHDIPGTSVAG